jgi:hypothetical protein
MCTRMWEKGPQVMRWCRAQGRNFSIPDQSRAGAKLRCILYEALCSNVWREQIQEAGKIRSCVMKWINGGSKEEEWVPWSGSFLHLVADFQLRFQDFNSSWLFSSKLLKAKKDWGTNTLPPKQYWPRNQNRTDFCVDTSDGTTMEAPRR